MNKKCVCARVRAARICVFVCIRTSSTHYSVTVCWMVVVVVAIALCSQYFIELYFRRILDSFVDCFFFDSMLFFFIIDKHWQIFVNEPLNSKHPIYFHSINDDKYKMNHEIENTNIYEIVGIFFGSHTISNSTKMKRVRDEKKLHTSKM